MRPRAAWRLEELGFERAYDFAGGKTAWIERGLPTEGTGPVLLVAGQVLRPATATCRPETRAGQVRAELEPGRTRSARSRTTKRSSSAAFDGRTSPRTTT